MAVRDLGAMAVRLNGDTARFILNFQAAETSLKTFAATATLVGDKAVALGRKMTFALSAPIAIVAGLGVKAFASFDKAMTESLAIMGDVNDKIRKEMAETAKDMSTKSTFAAKELGEAYFFLASAGLSAEASIKALPVVTKFAQAGAFNLSNATELLGGAQAALGLKVKNASKNMVNMERVANVLVKANVLAQATTEQFATALGRAGGTMKFAGVELEEGTAVLAAFAEVNRKAEVGGEAFARVLRLMIPAAIDNAGAYSRLGVEVFDANQNLNNMADIVENMEDAFRTMSVRQRAVALESLGFQRRMQGAILPLIGMSKRIKEFQKTLEGAGGTMDEVARNQLLAFSNQMTLLKNRLVLAGIELGQVLAPMVKAVADAVVNLTDKFRALTETQKRIVAGVLVTVALLGPMVLLFGLFAKLIGVVIPLAITLTKVIFGLSRAFAVLFITTGGWMLLLIGAGVTALGLFIAKMVQMMKATQGLSDTQKELADNVKLMQDRFGARSFAALKRMRQERDAAAAAATKLAQTPALRRAGEGPAATTASLEAVKFAGAAERGTVEAFRAEIGAGGQRVVFKKVEQNTKKSADLDKEMNATLKEMSADIKESLNLDGLQSEVVDIIGA